MGSSDHTIVIIWVMKIFFCTVLLCILATSYFLLLLGPYHFCPCAPLCMKCSLGISNFLEEISSVSHSIVFLYFFALITEEGFLISSCNSLELCIQMGISRWEDPEESGGEGGGRGYRDGEYMYIHG